MRQKQNPILLLALILSALVVAFLSQRPVSATGAAQEEVASDTACSPIDAIFLVDQSSSMSQGGNDPELQREFAVEAALDLMADIALDVCPGVIHRAAVVSFGTDAELDLTLREIGPFNPERPQDAFTVRSELKEIVEASDMGQTNAEAAFALAAEVLAESSSVGSDEEPRKRAILFVTDGVPCSGIGCGDPTQQIGVYSEAVERVVEEQLPFDETLLAREQCLDEVRARNTNSEDPLPPDERNACMEEHQVAPEAYANSTYIWMILMRNAGRPYPESVRNIFLDITSSHAGELVDVSNNRQDIPTTFREILEKLTGVRAARLECGNFAVNPYLAKARLVFYKFDPTVSVRLSYTDVEGNEYVLENGQSTGGFNVAEHTSFGANERYVLDTPYPGIWNLSSDDCNNLDAFYEPVQLSASSLQVPQQIPEYDRPPYFNESDPIYLRFELQDQTSGAIVPPADHTRFAINIEAVVQGPGGTETYTEFEWDEQEQQILSVEPLKVPVPGRYTADFTATSYRHEGEPTNVGRNYNEVFEQEYTLFEGTLDFEVLDVTPFVVEILEPTAGDTLTPIHIQPGLDGDPQIAPIDVRIQLVDRDGQPMSNAGEFFPNPGNAFTARVRASGESASTLLQPVDGSPHEFAGSIEDFNVAGAQTLEVELTGDIDREYAPDNRVTTLEFTREDETWRFAVREPADGEELRPIHSTLWSAGFEWPLPVAPLPVRLELVDEDGEPYDNVEDVMSYAPQVISATVTTEGQSGAAYLTPDPENPGHYTGQINGLEESGEYELVANLDLQYADYTPQSEQARVQFTRTDTLLSSPATYIVLFLLLLALVAFLVYRFFAVRRNKLTGELVFLDAGAEIATFNLYSGKNFRKISGRELNGYPQLGLKRVHVEHEPHADGGQQEEEGFDSGFYGNSLGVLVRYVTVEGDRSSAVLSPGQPAAYDNSGFMMQYNAIDE